MALKDLTTNTMIAITGPWLDPEELRPSLAKLKRCAGLLDDLDEAHANIIATRGLGDSASPAVAALIEKTSALDALHDRKARGLDMVLLGLRDLAEDPEEATALATARDEILGGTVGEVVHASYVDESEHSKQLDERLSKPTKQLLKTLVLGGVPLGIRVKEWQRAGVELGACEKEKQRLISAESKSAALGPADGVKARNAWVRTVNALLGMIALEKKLPAETRAHILGPLEAALAKSNKRRAAAAPPEVPVPAATHEGAAVE